MSPEVSEPQSSLQSLHIALLYKNKTQLIKKSLSVVVPSSMSVETVSFVWVSKLSLCLLEAEVPLGVLEFSTGLAHGCDHTGVVWEREAGRGVHGGGRGQHVAGV